MIRLICRSNEAAIRSLQDIPGLERFQAVSAKHSVEFTLRGSVLRHLLTLVRDASPNIEKTLREIKEAGPRRVAHVSSPPFDLFQITPFSTDIDLLHTGPKSLTPVLLREIFDEIPNAECFRWELRSEEEHEPFKEAQRFNGILPANYLQLTTSLSQGIEDPWLGAADIFGKNYRYVRNGFYRESPLYLDYRDLEVFSVLYYLRILLLDDVDWKQQPGFEDARAVMLDSILDSEVYIRIEDSSFIRAKLTHLILGLRAAAKSPARFSQLAKDSRLTEFVSLIRHPVTPIRAAMDTTHDKPGRAVIASAWLRGDRFRTPESTRFTGSDTKQMFDSVTKDDDFYRSERPKLAAGQELLIVSDPITITFGGALAVGSELVEEAPFDEGEFVCFAITIDGDLKAHLLDRNDEDLTAIVSVELSRSFDDETKATFLMTPNAIQIQRRADDYPDVLLARVNVFSCFNSLTGFAGDVRDEAEAVIRLFVIGLTEVADGSKA